MSDDIVAVLLRSKVICCGDDLLDNWHVYIGSRELLKHTLDNTAAAFVFTQKKHLVLNEGDYELDFIDRQVENDALNDVVALLTEHHLDQKLLIELADDLFLLLE